MHPLTQRRYAPGRDCTCSTSDSLNVQWSSAPVLSGAAGPGAAPIRLTPATVTSARTNLRIFSLSSLLKRFRVPRTIHPPQRVNLARINLDVEDRGKTA